MPDASGRFKGISVPELPWQRKPPQQWHECPDCSRAFDCPSVCIESGACTIPKHPARAA